MVCDFKFIHSLRAILSAIITLSALALYAQRPVEVIPSIMPPYPTEFHEFEEDFDNYTITIVNYTFESLNLYFHASLVGDNGVSATTNPDYRPFDGFNIGPRETYVMTGAEFRDLNAGMTENDFSYEGISTLQLGLGVMPEGNYELCITAFDFNTSEQLTIGCSFGFPVGNGDVPRIIYPLEEEIINEYMESFPITWEAPTSDPMDAMDFTYIVKLVDLTTYGDLDIEDVFLDGGVAVTLESEVMGMTTLLYNDEGDDPPLTYGHMYGVRVQAVDPFGIYTFENNGYSEIRTFFFGATPETLGDSTVTDQQLADLPSDCESRCNIPAIADSEPAPDENSVENLRMGHFFIQNYNLTQGTTGYNGEGEIVLNFLNDLHVRVQLNNIQFNAAGEIYAGKVRGIQDEGDIAEFLSYITFPVLDDQIQTASEAIPADISAQVGQYLRDTRMIAALAGMGEIGLPIGFSESVGGMEFTIGITDLLLTPGSAKAKVVSGMKLPMFEGDNWLMFVADSVCIHPAGFGGEYILSLGADLALNNDNENAFELRLLGGTSGADAICSMEMTCDGIQSVNVAGQLKFARSVIVPELEDGSIGEEKVNANFAFSWDNNNLADSADAEVPGVHWLASLSMDKFQVPGLNGWTFSVPTAWWDMSEISNPEDIVFPSGYTDQGLDFTGVYIANATIQPPATMCKGARPGATIQHMIIDPNLYAQIEADSLMRLTDGEIGGWAFSVDLFNLEIFNNELIEARLEGDLHMPLLDTSSHIDYFALIGQDETADGEAPGGDPYSYQFNMSFAENVRYNFMIAEGELYDDSVLDIVFHPSDSSQIAVRAMLHGELNINTDLFLPESFPDIPASITMPEIEYAFDYSSDTGFNSEGTYIGFASPTKFVSGFPINMDNFDVGISTADDNSISFDFNIAVSFAEGETDIGASAQFSLISNLSTIDVFTDIAGVGQAGEAFSTIKTFKLQGVQFDSITLSVDISALTLEGYIAFYNNPIEGGDENARDKGVRGEINVTLPIGPNGITGRLTAIFGNIGVPSDTYSEDFYSYWMVDGIVSFPVGIQFGTIPLGLYGIGGGVGYNMIQTQMPSIVNGEIVGEATYEPVYNSFRLSITAMIGTMPDPDAFNGDITLIAQFVNGGLDMIGIEGDAYVMTAMTERDNPQIYVGCDIYMYMPNETRSWSIEGGLNVAINLANGVMVGNMSPSLIPNQVVAASFHASPELFFFHMGAPDYNLNDGDDPRGSAMLNLGFMEAQIKTYMMVGHNIPTTLPPLPLPIQNILNNPDGDLDGTTSATQAQGELDASASETASGFAHGTYVELTTDINAYLLYARLGVYLGYDMNITQRSTQCANTGDIIGINGWYAEGQAYAGIEGALGIRVKVFGSEQEIKLMDLAAAIALYGGAPKPFYFGGQASVYYNILGGAISGSSSFSFSVGERCSPALDDPLAGIDFFEYIDPGQAERQIFVGAPMHIKLSMPVQEDIVIPQPIEDANGIIIDHVNLRYRPEISWTLRRDGSSQNLPFQSPHWTDDNSREQVYILPQAAMQAQTWHNLNLRIRAWDYQENRWLRVDGREWSQDTTIRFKTGNLPPDLYNYVSYTIPLPMERFFLQDEAIVGYVYFSQAINEDHYFPESNLFGGDYDYYVRFTNLEDQSESEIPFTYHSNNVSGNHNIRFIMPNLENEAIYALQVIRKANNMLTISGTLSLNRQISSYTSESGESTELTHNNEDLTPPGEQLSHGEFLLYHSYFRTSAYNTLRQKMQDVTVNNIEYAPNPSALYGKKVRIYLTLGEQFETRDFGNFNPSVTYPFITMTPRIRMLDLFNTSYHNTHAEFRILNYKNWYQNQVQGGQFYWNWPYNTLYDWVAPQTYRLPESRMNATLKPPLSDSEVNALWQSYSGASGLVATNTNFQFTSLIGTTGSGGFSLTSPLNCYITYDTHFRVSRDRKTVLDWAANYLASSSFGFLPMPYQYLFQTQYPGFITRYNSLLNDDLRLENYEGTYSIQFARNIATQSGEEVYNIFTMHNFGFETPNAGQLILQANPIMQWNQF